MAHQLCEEPRVILIFMNVHKALRGFQHHFLPNVGPNPFFDEFGNFCGSSSATLCHLRSREHREIVQKGFDGPTEHCRQATNGSVHSFFFFQILEEVLQRHLQRDHVSRFRLPESLKKSCFVNPALWVDTVTLARSLPATSSRSKHPRKRQVSR